MNIAEKRNFLEDKYLSKDFGIIKELIPVDNPLNGLQVHGVIAKLSKTDFIEYETDRETAGFSLESEDEASVAAIMEGLERYSSAIIPRSEIKKWEEVKSKEYKTFAKKFGKEEIDSSELLYCKFSSLDGEEIFLPAQYAYFPSRALNDPEIIHNTTNGLAAYTDNNEAKKRAIFELIEREGILRTWLNKIAPPKISLQDTEFEAVKESLSENNLSLDVFRANIIPEINVSIALIQDPRPQRAFLSFGAGTAFSLEKSVRKSIEEALHTRIWQEHYYDSQPEKPDEIRDLFDRSRYWASERNRSHIEFLYKNEETIPIDNSDNKTRIEKINLPSIYTKDITAPELERNGIFVVRAFCPDFQPFYLNEKKGRELKQICRNKPILDGVSTGVKSNNIPHPML